MQDKWYLLSIEEYIRDPEAPKVQMALERLDPERRSRIRSSAGPRRRAEELGAGLVLAQMTQDAGMTETPVYGYGEQGKPYWKNSPLHFNLSHSGNYVFGVLSEQEVGVDIQEKKAPFSERLVQRFFSRQEIDFLTSCATEEEKRNCFYRLWTRKEAYGKLTGRGIVQALKIDMSRREPEATDASGRTFILQEKETEDGYCLAVCKWKDSKG